MHFVLIVSVNMSILLFLVMMPVTKTCYLHVFLLMMAFMSIPHFTMVMVVLVYLM